MVDQIPDKIVFGIPPEFERARDDTENLRDATQAIFDRTDERADEAERNTASNVLAAETAASRAEKAAGEASAWVNAGAGVSIGAEEPAVKRNGHVWLVESAQKRDPLYPASTLFAGSATFPQRDGMMSDGSHVISAIRRWDASGVDSGAWTDFTLAQSLVSGSASSASLTSLGVRVDALETANNSNSKEN